VGQGSRTELRAVERLTPDDASASFARTVRRIQDETATPAEIRRYLEAKRKVSDKLPRQIEREQVAMLPVKYKDLGEADVERIIRLRDYLMSHPDLKFGNEFNPQMVKKLVYDLQKNGYPTSLKHDRLYDEMQAMYRELSDRIDEAYPRYSAVKPGEKIVVSPASEREVEELNKKFDFKFPDNITHTVDGYQVAHIIKNHGDPVAEAARAISLSHRMISTTIWISSEMQT